MRYQIFIFLTFLTLTSKAQLHNADRKEELLQKEIAFFTANSDSGKANALIEKATIYNELERPEEALRDLDRASGYDLSSFQSAEIKYQKMFSYFLSNDFFSCSQIEFDKQELVSINKENDYSAMKLHALNESEKWEECKKLLLQSSDSNVRSSAEQLPVSFSKKDPMQCSRLSGFLPGLGQTKSGYAGKGITSFLIHAGLITFIVYNAVGGFYITAVVIGVMPLLKFYKGGKRQSSNLAISYNEKKSAELKERYRTLIFQVTAK